MVIIPHACHTVAVCRAGGCHLPALQVVIALLGMTYMSTLI